MSIALFDEPPRVTITTPEVAGGSRVALLMGFSNDKGLEGILCLEDGSVTLLPVDFFIVDWRYNPQTDRWADATAQEGTQQG